MTKSLWTVLALLLLLTAGGNVGSQDLVLAELADLDSSIMRPDREIRLRWIEEYESAPVAFIDKEIELRLAHAQAQRVGTSINLLNYLQYTPSERSQGACGNCWVWANTGITEIALNVQRGIKERFSIQFTNSCKTDEYACCGGNPNMFASWYDRKGLAISWSNTNASYRDSSRRCSSHASAVSCDSIGTATNYPITSIQAQAIQTTGVGQSAAIANIKNILNQNRGIYFGLHLADQADWDAFYSFWGSKNESALWDPDDYCSHTWVEDEGGGHGVLIVGYNDEAADPDDRYWIALNSWGTAGGDRPNGLFLLPMHMNYDCKIDDDGFDWYSREFWTLDVTLRSPVEPKPNLTPYKPLGWSDKIVVSTSTGTHTDSSPLYTTDTLHVDWAFVNNSEAAISSRFYGALYVDGALRKTWYWDFFNALAEGNSNDYSIGSLGAGTHLIKVVVDSTGAVNESNEGDNEYTKVITVQEIEVVSIPSEPSGPTSGYTGRNCTYAAKGSSSSLGHSIQYRFYWGDGSYSNWSSAASVSKSWSFPGAYTVKAQARCAHDTNVISGWSSGLSVNIAAPITLQSPSSDAIFNVCSLYSFPTFSWTAGEPFKDYEIQFSGDENFSFPPPVKVKVPGTVAQKIMRSTIWKRIMLIPGPSGGRVYWRFLGMRANKTIFASEVRSIFIEPPQAVGRPGISNTQRSSLPALSWDNHCNIKFRVWFGSDGSFGKKIGFTFNISNPNKNNGMFEKVLTSHQWAAIRNLVEDIGNSPIYWYVESSDRLRRNAQTEVMSF